MHAKVHVCGLGLWPKLNASPICDDVVEAAYATCIAM